MKEESGVRISEFLDGELSIKDLNSLSRDCQQAENRKQIQDFARIGHAIRGESDVYTSIDVSDAVARAIADLPLAAPESAQRSERSQRGIFSSGWFKPLLGATFASAVAVFTVLVNQTVSTVSDNHAIPAVAQQQAITPENIELTQFARNSENSEVDVAVRNELNNYLVNHARSVSGGNYQGMVPYVRAVAYEPGQTEK
ncbi:MAG: sigma-E factor negative regulatory protein [Gammaproteobacteria bacterium]|nr:sigma-E factor negative regulatory protein [Gammaproteobacteria bacterium]